MVEVGEALKLMAEVKDSLDINVKQTFIDPLQLLQDKDLKEIGAKDRAASDGLWRHQVALLLRTFRQPLGWAQSAERRSPNHSPRCPTGAPGRELCEGFWEHIG